MEGDYFNWKIFFYWNKTRGTSMKNRSTALRGKTVSIKTLNVVLKFKTFKGILCILHKNIIDARYKVKDKS